MVQYLPHQLGDSRPFRRRPRRPWAPAKASAAAADPRLRRVSPAWSATAVAARPRRRDAEAKKLRTTLRDDHPGFLLCARVTDLTRLRYEQALADFAGPDADVVRHPWVTHDRVDALLESYPEHLFHRATSKSRAS